VTTAVRAAATPTLRELSAAAAFLVIPFQNLPLKDTALGGFGAAASMPFVAISMLLIAIDCLKDPNRVAMPKAAMGALAYVLLVTAYGLMVYGFEYRGVSLVSKGILAAIVLGFFAVAFRVGMDVPRRWLGGLTLAAIAVHLGGLAIHRPGGFGDAFNDVSFSSEPSHFGVVAVLLGLLWIYVSTRTFWRWALAIACFGAAFLSGSKGALGAMAIGVAATLLIRNWRRPKFLTVWAPILTAGTAIALVIVWQMLATDLSKFTSVATRSAGAITALLVGTSQPLGVGLGGFYPGFAQNVPRAWDMLTALLGSGLDLKELFSFAYSDDRNLSAKSLFGDTLIYFGWPGVLALGWAFRRLFLATMAFDRPRADALSVAVGFSIVATITYYTGFPMYVMPLVLGAIWKECTR
jgi:hypothetical protein